MSKHRLLAALAGLIALPVLLCICCSRRDSLPCDIYAAGGTPCVTAHSTARLLRSDYRGPLYQVLRSSDAQTLDIFPDRDGFADAAAQDKFLEGTIGYISVIYDQSGKGNDLTPAAPGTFKGPDKGEFNTMAIADMAPALADGHKVYGVYIMPGMGYRCNNARGLAIDDEPEGMYYVIDGSHFDSGCCFDYGNSSTNGRAVGTGTMETTYYGISTAWGRGLGEGPWIMSDMEAGLFSGYDAKVNEVPSITGWDFVAVYVNGGGGNQWDLRGADAAKDSVVTFYSGVRPGTPGSDAYYPMHKKGGMLLGNGGDNGNGSAGTFFEGVMTEGYPSDETIASVQHSIASARYNRYPVSVSRITTMAPGQEVKVLIGLTNTTGVPLKNIRFEAVCPDGWTAVCPSEAVEMIGIGGVKSATVVLKAPDTRSSGQVKLGVSWDGGSASLSERVRCAEPVKINEIQLSEDQFVELYNAADAPVDISGLELQVRRSGWAPITSAVIPEGTVLGAGEFYLLRHSPIAVTAPAGAGAEAISLSAAAAEGTELVVGAQTYTVVGEGTPAGAFTTIFIPVSTGPKLYFEAGTSTLPVASIAGLEPGSFMGIDLGGAYEVVKVTGVGTPSTQTSLMADASAGDTILSLEVTANLEPGAVLTISTGDRTETAVVKSVLKRSEAPRPRRFGQPAEPHEPGSVELEAPLKRDHASGVDVSSPGSGVTFEPATAHRHCSGDAIQPLGLPYILDRPLAEAVSAWDAVSPCGEHVQPYGYALSQTAGSVALVDPLSGAVLDAVVYGSQQSNSSANGTIASPELATLEGVQDGGGCIAVVPTRPFIFVGQSLQPAGGSPRSLVRVPDGADTDLLCRDFTLSENPTPGEANVR